MDNIKWVIFIIIIISAWIFIGIMSADCTEKGGVLVQGVYGQLVCVNGK